MQFYYPLTSVSENAVFQGIFSFKQNTDDNTTTKVIESQCQESLVIICNLQEGIYIYI